MAGKLKESYVLFANVMQNADGCVLLAGHAENPAPGSAQVPLQRLYPLRRRVEVLFKEPLENVHR